MAVKIIKAGQKPEETPMNGVCDHCGCVIECLLGDAKAQSDPREGPLYTVACPTCGRKIWVEPKK